MDKWGGRGQGVGGGATGGEPVRGLRGGGRRGWCEEWARSG